MTPAALLVRRTLGPLLVTAVAAALITAAVTRRQSREVEVTVSFTVTPPERILVRLSGGEPATESTVDVLRAADLFTETLVGWLTSPDVVTATYTRAQVELPSLSAVRLDRLFTAQRRGGQVVLARYRARSEGEAMALASAIVAEVKGRTASFNEGVRPASFTVTSARPVITPVVLSPVIRGAVAGIVVLLLGINAVLLWDFLKTAPPGSSAANIPTEG